MEVVRGLGRRVSPEPTWATVGTFDGVHRGHAALHAAVVERAREAGAVPAVVTFDRHPLETLAPDRAPCRLATLEQRLGFLSEEEIGLVLVLPFTDEVAALEAEEFVRAALVETLNVSGVVVGEDFRFGHGRRGDVAMLRELGAVHGFAVETLPLVEDAGRRISSTNIRRMVGEGDVTGAATLLGRGYRLKGEVVRGEGRGRGIGFPTLNLAPHERACLPGNGVYAGWWLWRGRRLPGVINVGVRPTFTPDPAPVIEIHVFDLDEDIYGERGAIEFTQRLRDEERFPSVDALVEQIRRDADQARGILGS